MNCNESDFDVIWTGLYGEDIVDYKDISGYNYNWENPKGYLWYYCKYYKDYRYNKIRATNYFTYELLRFDSDEPDIRIDVDNCIYFTNESKEEEGNYKIVINSVLEKTNTERKNGQDGYSNYSWDEEPGKNEEYYSNSKWYNIGLDPSVNPFTGYEVLGYEYNNSFTPKEYFRDRVTVYSNDILNLYYIRSSYYFTIANQEGIGNIYHLYKDNVDRLDLNNINMPYGVDSDYTFAGLFDSSDKDNATMVVAPDGNFVKEVKGNPDNDPTIFKYKSKYYQRSSYVMPAHNVQLFAHWDPPVRQVTFVLDENSTNTVVANDVHKGDTLSEVLAAHTEISKTRDDYQFVNWYYLDEAGNEVLFPESAIILDDVTLYAKWQKVAGEGTYYLSAYDAQTSQPILDTDGKNVTYTGEAQIGSAVKVNVSMLADNNSALNGYVVVGDSEKSVDSLTDQYEFRFYFTKAAESWNYEVHCLANYGTDEDPIYYDLGTKTNSTTQDQILIDPGIFDNYYLQGIRNEGTVSAQTYAILNKPADTSETAQVYFIYKLDTDVIFSLEGNSKLYDGTACEATYNTISDKISLTGAMVEDIVEYQAPNSTEWTTDAPVNAGSYKVRARTEVVQDGDSDNPIILWNSEDYPELQQYINIFQRVIVLESASQVFLKDDTDESKEYRDTFVRYADGSEEFVKGQGVEITNTTVLKDIGSKQNIFSYMYLSDTDESNYFISTNYGTIEVTGKLTNENETTNSNWPTLLNEEKQTIIGKE